MWIMTYLRSFSIDVRSWASCYPNLIGFPSARCSGLCSACPCASCCASCASSSSCSAGPHPDLEFDEWLASACSLPSNNSRSNYVSKQQNYIYILYNYFCNTNCQSNLVLFRLRLAQRCTKHFTDNTDMGWDDPISQPLFCMSRLRVRYLA